MSYAGTCLSTRNLLQVLVAEFQKPASLITEEFGFGDRKAGLPGDCHGVGPLGAELFLQDGVLLDGFEELGEVFLGHGSLGFGMGEAEGPRAGRFEGFRG